MNKVATNIIKGVLGKVQTISQREGKKNISWINRKILKHQSDVIIKVFRYGALNIFYRRPYELLHSFRDIFSREIYRFDSQTSQPLVIDCGANIGISVLYFKHLYPSARIVAFEPDEQNFDILQKNVKHNKQTGIELYPSAVWISNDEISFSSNASEASHISKNNSDKKVTAIRLSDILARENKVDFLKIDIEGAEWQVLMDCKMELFKVENLFLEYHGKTNETYKLADILNLLKSAGFSVYLQNAADNLELPFINKTTKIIYDVQLNIFCFKNNK